MMAEFFADCPCHPKATISWLTISMDNLCIQCTYIHVNKSIHNNTIVVQNIHNNIDSLLTTVLCQHIV